MTYSTHTTLLSRLSAGIDPFAWRDFNARYGDLIRGFSMRYGLQAADCDDIVQEVLLSLSKTMGTFVYDSSKGRFRSYLKTMTLRTIFRNLRQKRSQLSLEENDNAIKNALADEMTEALWEEEWRQYHIRCAMTRIENVFSEKDRMAFSCYALKGMGVQETAESLGISVDQVYQAKSRILRRLRAVIEEQIREEG